MQIKVQRIKKIARKMLNDIADIELYEWPPRCTIVNYQPVRPKREDIISKKCDDEGSCNATSK